jgi:hypothetical protein
MSYRLSAPGGNAKRIYPLTEAARLKEPGPSTVRGVGNGAGRLFSWTSYKWSRGDNVLTGGAMKPHRPPFPSMDELSAYEREILRFLRIQLLQQASDVQIAHNNRLLDVEMRYDADTIRTQLERLADRGYVERRTGLLASGVRTYAYRLTEAGEAALRGTL